MLAGLPGCLLASISATKKPKQLPRVGEFFRFLDPVTEMPVVRLTSLASNSFLPGAQSRFISVKERSLVFSSDRSGSLAPYRVDLHTGVVTQLVQPRNLALESLCMNRKRDALYLLDGDRMEQIALANGKSRVLAEGVSSFCEAGPAGNTETDFFVIRQRRLEMLSRGSAPLAEDVENFCLARPGGAGCLFLRAGGAEQREFWYAHTGPSPAKPILLAQGKVTNPLWTANGQALLFLREVVRANNTIGTEIHAASPESPAEACVAATSLFAAFAPNADATVFVGASGSKAQPTIILLLASPQREFTLCEHRASHPAAVSPVFSPDSRRVYFQSDREGKSALYSVNVEALVESTPSGEA
jgi:oligogalacturonide lyase